MSKKIIRDSYIWEQIHLKEDTKWTKTANNSYNPLRAFKSSNVSHHSSTINQLQLPIKFVEGWNLLELGQTYLIRPQEQILVDPAT